ncbi:hypothetical protein V0R37_18635 [Pollutimonas sp. H1-120]|uniref:hypothetical protein n=1 Tax=Pollutimonas sp. H1-120 TaxID=3148824 RepID=UPI003B521D80
MVRFPIHVPRDIYRGRDAAKLRKLKRQHQIAQDLEEAINKVVAKQENRYGVYDWAEFARMTGYSISEIAAVGYRIDGGSNGFTVCRPELPDIVPER